MQGSEDALLARLEDGKLPGFSCSINHSHPPPVWACDTCANLRCAACMQVCRQAGAILCWNCARPVIVQGCTSLCRVEEFYETQGLKYWDFDADAGDLQLADDPPALSLTGAAAVGAGTPRGSSAHAAAFGAPTDSRKASSADDTPVAALPLGTAVLEYSSSWATVLQEYMMGQGLGNDEVIVTDRHHKILILVDHEHAKRGEMEDIPDPDQFPLRLQRRELGPIDCVGVKNHEGPHRCGLHFGVPRVSRGQEYAARSSAGSSNDHLQAGRAPALAGAAAGSVFAAAPLVSAAEIGRISRWRRCEHCGWTRLPEHITCACVVCWRSVVCHGCGPHWRGVCYTCVDKFAN